MFFKKKPIPPLAKASTIIEEVQNIAYSYKHDKSYMPDTTDLKEFDRLENKIWHTSCLLEYIVRCMHQRAEGKPEGAKRFNDPAADI